MPPTVQDVREGLLLGGGEALTGTDIQRIIDRATERVTLLVGSTLATSETGEDLILQYSIARAQRLADAASGYAESPAAKDAMADAKELLAQLQSIQASQEQGGGQEIDVDEDLIDGPDESYWDLSDPAAGRNPLSGRARDLPWGSSA